MIYLLVDDGTDPNLENQTLYIDPSQLAAAAGGLVLQGDGGLVLRSEAGVPALLQGSAANCRRTLFRDRSRDSRDENLTLSLLVPASHCGAIPHRRGRF